MNTPALPHLAGLNTVFHPSDLTPASEVAFRHALKIALLARAQFTVLHVAEEEGAQWSEFPGVRPCLERWGLIPPGSGREAVKTLGLAVQKIVAHSHDPLRACQYYLEKHPAELVVLAASQRETRAAWPQADAPAAAPRCAGPMTLFLPEAGGFVAASDGALQLRRIVVALAAEPAPQLAVNAAARLAHALGLAVADFILVHIGEAASLPQVRTAALPGWRWRCDVRSGEVGGQLLAALREHAADLIVMATDGRHGFLDALRGQVTERILHEGQRPLLAIS